MVLAAFITTCFVIGGVSAWYLVRGDHFAAGRRGLKLAVAFAAIAVPLQIFVGDLHGLNVGKHQRSEEHTSELQSLMRISYAVFCLKKKISDTVENYIHSQLSNKNHTEID